MHYTGMAAINMEATIHYNPLLFSVSVLIAIAASFAALVIVRLWRDKTGAAGFMLKSCAGIVMGAAISGMHYTGMAAASFTKHPSADASSSYALDQGMLAYAVIGATFLILQFALFMTYLDRRTTYFSVQNAEASKEREEALQANVFKSQFLANMSHELRTPLNAIIGYSEMLKEEAEDMGEQMFVEDLDKINKAGKHLLSLINDILDLSKIEAGKMDLYLEPCDIPVIIQDVLTTVKPLLEKNGNKLESSFPEGSMITDVTKLRQLLFNLLSNAGKFTKEGTVWLDAGYETVQEKRGIAFRVKDTGIGMTPEQMEHLFEAFKQGDSSTTKKYGGTGLGLAISKKICELMGGSIQVQSKSGQGTTFTVWLPLSNNESEGDHDFLPEKSAAEASGGVTVLVIDDDPAAAQLMKRFLEKEDWQVAFAENGKKGIELARQLRPSVICLDVLMPGMDGWSVLSLMKNDPELAGIPVVITSMTDDKNMGYALGASDYLTKPVNRERLLPVLNRLVPGRISPNILVIEDDIPTSQMMDKMLEKEGYRVTKAGNGLTALLCMEQEMPQLILLDLMMPGMDGFEFVEELRKREEWHQVPVVVVTAKTITPEERLRLNGYVKSYVQKAAFDRNALIRLIRDMIVRSNSDQAGRKRDDAEYTVS
jgi:signal transduction histidine kinase/DNA-binding response OmpR family regulator